MDKKNSKIRSIPFETRRPTLAELCRSHARLYAVYQQDSSPVVSATTRPVVLSALKVAAKMESESFVAIEEVALAYKRAPLYEACLDGRVTPVLQLLNDGAEVNYAWNTGAETALHAAGRVVSFSFFF